MAQFIGERGKEHQNESYDLGYKNGYEDAVSENTKTIPAEKWDRKSYDSGYREGYRRGLLELTER